MCNSSDKLQEAMGIEDGITMMAMHSESWTHWDIQPETMGVTMCK